MTLETHAIILNHGEDARDELYRNWREGNLLTKLDEEGFRQMIIENFKFVRMAEQHETDHRNHNSIWVEIQIRF